MNVPACATALVLSVSAVTAGEFKHPFSRPDVIRTSAAYQECNTRAKTLPSLTKCAVDANRRLDAAFSAYYEEVAATLPSEQRVHLSAGQIAWQRYRDRMVELAEGATPVFKVGTWGWRYNDVYNRFLWVAMWTSDFEFPEPRPPIDNPLARPEIASIRAEYLSCSKSTSATSEKSFEGCAASMRNRFDTAMKSYLEERLPRQSVERRRQIETGQFFWEDYRKTFCDADPSFFSRGLGTRAAADCWLRETVVRFTLIAETTHYEQ